MQQKPPATTAVLQPDDEGQSLTRLLRLLSHDLRNPIASAKMGTDSIVRSKDVPDNIRRKASRASLALARADELISRFGDLRMLQAGGALPLRREALPLAEVLPEVTASWHPDVQARLQVRLEAAAVGKWDAQYMLRAVGSLVDNAIKYGQRNAPIELRLFESGGDIVLDVCNEGEPIDAEQRRHMLATTPWQRMAQAHGDRPGWGLGLLLARSVAQGHDGALELTSHDNKVHATMRFASDHCAKAASPAPRGGRAR